MGLEKIVVSCSHNKENANNFESAKIIANRKVIFKFLEDIEQNKVCRSINFRRWNKSKQEEDYVDENKFLMSLYKDVPVFVPVTLPYTALGKEVSVYGSQENRDVVELFNAFLDQKYGISDAVDFIKEGEILSLGNSILRSAKNLNLKKSEHFAFVPGDCPLGFYMLDQLNDEDIDNHGIIFNLNTPDAAKFEDVELFNRNFYRYIIDENNIRKLWKESNFWVLNKNILKKKKAINAIYKLRQGTKLNPFSLAYELGSSLKWWKFPGITLPDLANVATTIFMNKVMKTNLRWGGDYRTGELLGEFIFETPTRIKAKHNNPFLIKDIDAWHDLWYYQDIFKAVKGKTEYDGLDLIHPFGKLIFEFNEYMQDIKNNVGVLNCDYEQRRKQELIDFVPAPFKDDIADYFKQRNQGEHIMKSVKCAMYHTERFKKYIKENNIPLKIPLQ